jgi:hypothetical protein
MLSVACCILTTHTTILTWFFSRVVLAPAGPRLVSVHNSPSDSFAGARAGGRKSLNVQSWSKAASSAAVTEFSVSNTRPTKPVHRISFPGDADAASRVLGGTSALAGADSGAEECKSSEGTRIC